MELNLETFQVSKAIEEMRAVAKQMAQKAHECHDRDPGRVGFGSGSTSEN